MFLMNNMKRGVTWRPLPPDPAPCRSGAERPRVGPRGDEELPEWDARVQVRHERQDRHRQAGQGRGHRRGWEEVSDGSGGQWGWSRTPDGLLWARSVALVTCGDTWMDLSARQHCDFSG